MALVSKRGTGAVATIAITGISGLVGRRVHERLAGAGHRVVGIDTRAPSESAGLVFREADVRSRPDVLRALRDVDAVVHLAFDAPGDAEPDRSVNVGGSQVVIDAAGECGVDTFVAMSSAMVYGAAPDNPLPLDETAPLRAGDDFALAAHKREVEDYLAEHASDDMRVVVLRPAMVVGSDADILLTRSLQGTRLLSVRGHRPPIQFVHVDDLAAAVVLAVEGDLEGPYNVACEGWLSFDEAREVLGRRLLEVPEEVARTATARAHRLGLSRLPPSALPWVMYPWVVSPQRLVDAGWRPTLSNRDTAAILAAEVADRIEVAGVSADRRTVARAGMAAAASLAGGILAVGLLSRRRRNTDPAATDDEPEPASDDDPEPVPDDDAEPRS